MKSRFVFSLLLIASLSTATIPPPIFASVSAAATQESLAELETKLKAQYAAIEAEIGSPPSRLDHPSDYRDVLRAWQDRLAARFNDAANTVEKIIPLDSSNSASWRERLETLRVYGSPISSPTQRTVFGRGEVQKQAKVLSAPRATYTDAARANGITGDVRLRLILSADGSVVNIFPIKSLPHGLTESAMTAAKLIRFEPAVRNGQPVSEFMTLVYDFRKDDATPHVPRTVF